MLLQVRVLPGPPPLVLNRRAGFLHHRSMIKIVHLDKQRDSSDNPAAAEKAVYSSLQLTQQAVLNLKQIFFEAG